MRKYILQGFKKVWINFLNRKSGSVKIFSNCSKAHRALRHLREFNPSFPTRVLVLVNPLRVVGSKRKPRKSRKLLKPRKGKKK